MGCELEPLTPVVTIFRWCAGASLSTVVLGAGEARGCCDRLSAMPDFV